MRITLNLASRPYVELRPLFRRLQVLGGVLVVTALLFWFMLRTARVRAEAAHAQVVAIQNSMADAQSQKGRAEAEMQQPANAAVLTQAQFLNTLFLHKAFSWTAVMMDLERVLPPGVQVLNIDPQVAKDGRVVIRMRVAGPHERAVDLLRNLEHSRRFLKPRLVGESAQTASGANGALQPASTGVTGVNFDLLADYNPLPAVAKNAAAPGIEAEAPHRRAAHPHPAGTAHPAPATMAPARPLGAGRPR